MMPRYRNPAGELRDVQEAKRRLGMLKKIMLHFAHNLSTIDLGKIAEIEKVFAAKAGREICPDHIFDTINALIIKL